MKKISSLILCMAFIVLNLSSCQLFHTHTYGEWQTTQPATCYSDGAMVKRCACGNNQSAKISKKQHDYENYICIYCGDDN